MAADALPALVSLSQLPSAIKTLLDDMPSSGSRIASQNHLHGSLLQVFFLIDRFFDVCWVTWVCYRLNRCLGNAVMWSRCQVNLFNWLWVVFLPNSGSHQSRI